MTPDDLSTARMLQAKLQENQANLRLVADALRMCRERGDSAPAETLDALAAVLIPLRAGHEVALAAWPGCDQMTAEERRTFAEVIRIRQLANIQHRTILQAFEEMKALGWQEPNPGGTI
ncbi:MAG: hypothetical protein SFU57_00155 [Gemmatimonadales bacterium]|nr:hypothetical protein [Gemmatimonadales bacterium]